MRPPRIAYPEKPPASFQGSQSVGRASLRGIERLQEVERKTSFRIIRENWTSQPWEVLGSQ